MNMIDIRLIREEPDKVKENIKKKFQDEKLKLLDDIIKHDETWRKKKYKLDELRSKRNKVSQEINALMKSKKKEEAQKLIKEAKKIADDIEKAQDAAQKEEDKIKAVPHSS